MLIINLPQNVKVISLKYAYVVYNVKIQDKLYDLDILYE